MIKYKKNNKGITLVSLVVTIIILIILAGVSINMTLGEGGIITIAKRAKENMELAQIEEQEQLNTLYSQLEGNEGMAGGEIDYDAIAKLNNFKKQIADYIEEAGGIKPEYTADAETFGERIKGIVKEVTKDATATEEDITEGKTAWVNGEKIIGNRKNISKIVNNFGKNPLINNIPGKINNYSGYYSTWYPSCAFDNVIGGYNLWSPPADATNFWLEYLFESEITTDTCFIVPLTGINSSYGGKDGTNITITMEVSNDGTNYKRILSETTYINGNSKFNPIFLEYEPVTAKYFKWSFNTEMAMAIVGRWSGGIAMIQLYN